MTMPSTVGAYPPDNLIPAPLVEPFRRHKDLTTRLNAVEEELFTQYDDAAIAAAQAADEELRREAVRNNKSAADVGSPNLTALADRHKAAGVEFETILAVYLESEYEICDIIWNQVMPDDKMSGRAALNAARAKYRKALDAVVAARDEFTAAATLPQFFKDAVKGEKRSHPARFQTTVMHAFMGEAPYWSDPQTQPHPLTGWGAMKRYLYADADTTATKEYMP